MRRWFLLLGLVLLLGNITGCDATEVEEIWDIVLEVLEEEDTSTITPSESSEAYDLTLTFPAERYPETAGHIADAISEGHSDICTIDRSGSDRRRELSLADIPTKSGYDRDEWPMAMCEEGGEGASVRYIDPSDNRGAGSWVGNQLREHPDGTRVKFVVR